MNQKGFSIVEMIICVMIFAIVTALFHKCYAQMTKNSNRAVQMSKMQVDARSAVTVLIREIRNTGCKYYLSPNGAEKYDKHLVTSAFVADSSSFIAKEGDPSDTLIIYKAKLSETGEYLRTDSIEYYLEGTNLVRKLNNVDMKLCSEVFGLQFQYGVFASDSMLLHCTTPSNWLIANESGTAPTSSVGSQIKFNFTNISKGMIYYNTSFNNDTLKRCVVSIDISSDKIFDSLYCCVIQNTTNKGVEKFLPQSHIQHLSINVEATTTGKIAFRYWTKGSGQLTIKNVEVKRQDYGKFVWYDEIPTIKKKSVRAIKISMATRSKSNIGIVQTEPIQIGDISIPRSGKYEWKIRTEIVETLNNGTF